MLFFPQDERGVEVSKRIFEEGCAKAGLPLLFWREVPIDPHDLGSTARACMPTILQAFVGVPKTLSVAKRSSAVCMYAAVWWKRLPMPNMR